LRVSTAAPTCGTSRGVVGTLLSGVAEGVLYGIAATVVVVAAFSPSPLPPLPLLPVDEPVPPLGGDEVDDEAARGVVATDEAKEARVVLLMAPLIGENGEKAAAVLITPAAVVWLAAVPLTSACVD
jgi:hypothetical protein